MNVGNFIIFSKDFLTEWTLHQNLLTWTLKIESMSENHMIDI